MRCHPDTASVSHGGYSRTRATIETGDISTTSSDPISGGTTIPNCSMLLPIVSPIEEMFEHRKRAAMFLEQFVPARCSLLVRYVWRFRGTVTDSSAVSNPPSRTLTSIR